jgi:hypothetical protein
MCPKLGGGVSFRHVLWLLRRPFGSGCFARRMRRGICEYIVGSVGGLTSLGKLPRYPAAAHLALRRSALDEWVQRTLQVHLAQEHALLDVALA